MTAAPSLRRRRRRRRRRRGYLFCAASRSCPRNQQSLLFQEIWLSDIGRGEERRIPSRLRSGNFDCQRVLILVQPQCPPACSAGKKNGQFPCGRIYPAPGRCSSEAIFLSSAWRTFPVLGSAAERPLGLQKWLPFWKEESDSDGLLTLINCRVFWIPG